MIRETVVADHWNDKFASVAFQDFTQLAELALILITPSILNLHALNGVVVLAVVNLRPEVTTLTRSD